MGNSEVMKCKKFLKSQRGPPAGRLGLRARGMEEDSVFGEQNRTLTCTWKCDHETHYFANPKF